MNNNPFTRTFTLVQHSPLIHFQHQQAGATLRATELKPKLDRFLTKRLSAVLPELAASYGEVIERLRAAMTAKSNSLYKVRIGFEKNNPAPTYYYFESRIRKEDKEKVQFQVEEAFDLQKVEIIAPSPYFANNDKRNNNELEQARLGVMWDSDLTVCFSSKDERLLELIEQAFPCLICTENFGGRQSKGFGSFSVKGFSQNQFEKVVKSAFDYCAKYPRAKHIGEIFSKIDTDYKSLKNKQPADSAIRDYFLAKTPPIEWEKPTITKKVVKGQSYTNPSARYVRALLGLAELHDYQQLGVKVKIRHVGGEINRFRSPILFKVYQNALYLLANQPDAKMLEGPSFYFFKGDDPGQDPNKATLSVPDEFDIADFLHTYITNQKGWKNV